MRLPTWQVSERTTPSDYQGIAIQRWRLTLETPLLFNHPVIGIDPGQVNMGAALLYSTWADLYEFTLPASSDAIERMMSTTHAIQYLLKLYPHLRAACLEGAAYLALAGQVPLAENRAAAAIALLQGRLAPVQIVPPGRIRENVFGYGRWRSQEVWPELPPNAGTALGCAVYMYKQYRKEQISP